MKTKIVLNLIFLFFMSFIINQSAMASSYYDCDVKAKIIKVNKEPNNSENSYIYVANITVEFIRIIQRSGFLHGHSLFDDIVGTTEDISIEIRDKKLLNKLKKDEIVYIKYGTAYDISVTAHKVRELIEMPEREKINQIELTVKEKNGLFGYVDNKGKFAIEAKYTIADEFNENGVAYVADKKVWYLINKKGDVILTPYIVDNAPDELVDNRARFVKDGKFGYYNDCGESVYTAWFDYAFPFEDGCAIVVQDCKIKKDGENTIIDGGKWGMLDINGGTIVPWKYKKVFPMKNDKVKAITFDDEVIYYNYHSAILDKMDLRERTVKEKDDKYGYVDEKGKFVIAPNYDIAQEFDERNVTGVLDKDGWHIINKDGKKLFKPFIFDNGPDYFVKGKARFVENGKMGYFNEFGEKLVEAKYDFADVMVDGYFGVVSIGCKYVTELEVTHIEGGKWGMVDISGNIIVPIEYKSVDDEFDKDGKVAATDFNGKTVYYNRAGKIVK